MAKILITRDKGKTLEEIDEELLVKKEGIVNNGNERTTWVEYYLKDQLVHRSAHVQLKNQPT